MFKNDEIFESFQEQTKNVEIYKDYDFSEGYNIVYRPYYKRKHKLDPPKRNRRVYNKKRAIIYQRLYNAFKLFDTKIPYKLRKELIDMLREEFKDDRKSNTRTY
jgi:hypothetical protein